MKTMFRISLMPNATSLAEKMAVMAAENNGGARQFTLSQIKTVADGNLLEYPSLNKDTTCELIGDNLLHLDRKVGEPIDIYVNNRLVARGEVVIVDERLGVTMTEIIKSGG